jgi:hypothetical protein
MDKITLGIICGLAFGVIDILIMIPLKYDSKRKKAEAMSSAFLERFMIGFLIPTVDLGINPIITGVILGVSLSLPSAIITRVYGPIVGIGLAGGIIIGYVTKAVVG